MNSIGSSVYDSDSGSDSGSDYGYNYEKHQLKWFEETQKTNEEHNQYTGDEEIYKEEYKNSYEQLEMTKPMQGGGTSDKIIVSSVFGIVILISSVLLGSVG